MQSERERQAWNARAIELSVERHLLGKARFLGAGAGGTERYAVFSSSEPTERAVLYDPPTGVAACDCPAGAYSHPCAHAGAALLLAHGLVPDWKQGTDGE